MTDAAASAHLNSNGPRAAGDAQGHAPLLGNNEDDGASSVGGGNILASDVLPQLRESMQIQLPGQTTSEQIGRLIPVFVVMFLIFLYYITFVGEHCLPLVTSDSDATAAFWAGAVELSIFHVLLIFMVYCYFRCILTHPGAIPATWQQIDVNDVGACAEKKQGGERRYCRWCAKYKPDRAHHCRICRSCVLKMDHHCPWINNCVGFANQKYFILCILYSVTAVDFAAACHFIGSSHEDFFAPIGSISIAIDVIYGLFAFVLTLFASFHAYLLLTARTTLEFRERMWSTKGSCSIYDRSYYENICQVLGKQPSYWFVPIPNTPGDGLHWLTSGEDENAVSEAAFSGFETKPVGAASAITGSGSEVH